MPPSPTVFPPESGFAPAVLRRVAPDRPTARVLESSDREAPSRQAARYLEHAALQARLRARDADPAAAAEPPATRIDTGTVMTSLAPLLLRAEQGSFGAPTSDATVRRSLAPLPGGRTLTVDVQPAVLRFDPQDLARLLGELLDNGRRYAPAGATIRLRGAPGAGGYQLSVTNPGEALPRWALASLRTDPAEGGAADPAGRAFGLPIAALLARLNDARLEVLRGAGHPNTLRVIVRPA